jgi:hypothetical protein
MATLTYNWVSNIVVCITLTVILLLIKVNWSPLQQCSWQEHVYMQCHSPLIKQITLTVAMGKICKWTISTIESDNLYPVHWVQGIYSIPDISTISHENKNNLPRDIPDETSCSRKVSSSCLLFVLQVFLTSMYIDVVYLLSISCT